MLLIHIDQWYIKLQEFQNLYYIPAISKENNMSL
jgi:hypothetical protein